VTLGRLQKPKFLQQKSVVGLVNSSDVTLRVIGSVFVILAYFIILHVSTTFGVILNMVGDTISLPYFIRTKSWDVVIMIAFLLVIALSHLL